MVRSTKRPTTLTHVEADRFIQEMYGYSGREAMDEAQAQPLPPYAFDKALSMVDGTAPGGVDIAAMVTAWRAEDSARIGKGGRPAHVSLRAILILRLAHAIAHRPQTIRLMTDTFVMTLRNEELEQLGIVDDDADAQAWYQRISSANNLLVKTMDPSIFPTYTGLSSTLPPAPERLNRHRRLTRDQQHELEEFREPHSEVIAEKGARLDDFMFELNANVIRMAQTVGMLDGYDGAVALDATYIGVHGRGTYKDNKRAGSTTTEAGLWVRGGDHGVSSDTKTPIKTKFGFEADIVTMTRGDSYFVPELILGFNVHRPGVIGHVAETIFSRIAALELPKGDCSVDRAYNNLDPASFAHVMYRHGYELVFDYPHDELGQQTSIVLKGTGYVMVDGTWYLATMEDGLITCTHDHLSRDQTDELWIDEATMLERVEQRRAYQLHRHGRRDPDGYQRYRLPEASNYIAYDPITGEVEPDSKPTNTTVTIALGMGARWGQKYPYRTPEWQAGYNLRSTVERKNRELKHDNFFGLESADRRPQRGYAANAVAIAMLITSANLNVIDNFLRTSEGIDTTKSTRRRKARRKEEFKIADVSKQRDGRSTPARSPKAA